MPYILGLTGGIGSGKSAASRFFESLNITVVDADIVAREVVALGTPALDTIRSHFGSSVLLASGELNRTILRERIFSSPHDKQWLEDLLHPQIRASISQQLQEATSVYVILSSPLLFETQQNQLVDSSLVVDCPEDMQKERALQRDKVDSKQIDSIMASQLSRTERNAQATMVISNTGSLDDLRDAILHFHENLLLNIQTTS